MDNARRAKSPDHKEFNGRIEDVRLKESVEGGDDLGLRNDQDSESELFALIVR